MLEPALGDLLASTAKQAFYRRAGDVHGTAEAVDEKPGLGRVCQSEPDDQARLQSGLERSREGGECNGPPLEERPVLRVPVVAGELVEEIWFPASDDAHRLIGPRIAIEGLVECERRISQVASQKILERIGKGKRHRSPHRNASAKRFSQTASSRASAAAWR